MTVRKALTFRASSIGDCLMGKYLLENIHAQFPQARLGIVVAGRAGMIRDLVAAYPWLEIIEASRRRPLALLSLSWDFRDSDLVVTQYAGKRGGTFSLMSKLFARLLAKKGGLVGFTDASRWNRALYDRLVPVRSDTAVVEHDRAALRAAGLAVSLPFPTLSFVQDDTVLAALGLEAGGFVVVHLFAGGKGRSVSPGKGRELLRALRGALPKEVAIVVSGAAADQAAALTAALGTGAKVIAGDTSLQGMMNLIKRSRAVVSVDTGMAHIAAQLGTPLIVMRTCVAPNWWFPGQYGSDAPLTVFVCDECCAAGHVYADFPACINGIDMHGVAARAAAVVG